MHIHKDNLSVSVLYGHGEILSSVIPYILCIYRKNKINKNPDTLIIRKQPIKEPVKPRKRAKEITLTDVEKGSTKEAPPSFWHKIDYKYDNNEKIHGSDDSASETGCCVRNLAKLHENKDNEEFREDTSEIYDTNESKLSKD